MHFFLEIFVISGSQRFKYRMDDGYRRGDGGLEDDEK